MFLRVNKPRGRKANCSSGGQIYKYYKSNEDGEPLRTTRSPLNLVESKSRMQISTVAYCVWGAALCCVIRVSCSCEKGVAIIELICEIDVASI